MKLLLKTEALALAILAFYLFSKLSYPLYYFPVLILLPDIGMLGYLINTKIGALTYNLTHHLGLAILVYLLGLILNLEMLSLIGIIIFAHSSIDRVLGYGLKYPDSFKNTHLGNIGQNKSS